MGLENGVPADGDGGRHVEDVADGRSAARDGPVAAHRPGVAVDRSDADDRGEAAAVEAPEFGQLGDQGAGGDVADTRDGGEQVLRLAPGRGAADGVVQIPVDVGELRGEGLERGLDGAPDEGGPGLGAAIALHADHLDDLTAAGDKFVVAPGELHIHPWSAGQKLLYRQRSHFGAPDPTAVTDVIGVFATVAQLARAGKVDAAGMPKHPLQLAATMRTLTKHGGYDAKLPVAAQNVLSATLGRVAEAFGFRGVDPSVIGK